MTDFWFCDFVVYIFFLLSNLSILHYVLASSNYGVYYKPLMDWYAFQVADITHALQQPAGRKVSLRPYHLRCSPFGLHNLGSGNLSDVKLHASHLVAFRVPCYSSLDHLYIQ